MQSPYGKLFDSNAYEQYFIAVSNPNIPTDDSPFYFAKEPVPHQMVILIETVLGIYTALSVLLIFHAIKKKSKMDIGSGFLLFALFIGIGFRFIEITYPKIPFVAGHANNGADSHTIFHSVI